MPIIVSTGQSHIGVFIAERQEKEVIINIGKKTQYKHYLKMKDIF